MEKDFLLDKLKDKEDGTYTVCQSMEKYDNYRIDFIQQGILRSVTIEYQNGAYRLASTKRPSESFINLQELLSYYWNQVFSRIYFVFRLMEVCSYRRCGTVFIYATVFGLAKMMLLD
jgi:hypothetical protein